MKSIRPLAATQSVVLNGDREAILARRERLDKLYAAIAATSPAWARLKPWQVEQILEHGAAVRTQGSLFDEGGDR